MVDTGAGIAWSRPKWEGVTPRLTAWPLVDLQVRNGPRTAGLVAGLSMLARRVGGLHRLANFKPAIILFGMILTGAACDTASSTLTGRVTSVSSSEICLNPENKNVEPFCLQVTDPQALAGLSEGSCVRTVSTLDDKLIRIEALGRVCRLPTR